MGVRTGAVEALVTPPGAWRGRRVLVTGHTGFKGAWLCQILLDLGAEVHGLALAPDTAPSLFELLGLAGRMPHRVGDIADPAVAASAVAACAPEAVFHLAAQPLVRRSYREPAATWRTNVLGTVNLLQAVRAHGGVRAVVVVTSDKCYEDRGDGRVHDETGRLGGHDPYSSSKAAAELAVASWRSSFPDLPPTATVRAGNVIGGGDWGEDRLVPDVVRAAAADATLRLRRPDAVRPWQHVLEPLSAYMDIAWRLQQAGGGAWAEAWNIGPDPGAIATVGTVAGLLVRELGRGRLDADPGPHPHETAVLRLDAGKARTRLGWAPAWGLDETVRRTAAWYRAQASGADAVALCQADIAAYRAAMAAPA